MDNIEHNFMLKFGKLYSLDQIILNDLINTNIKPYPKNEEIISFILQYRKNYLISRYITCPNCDFNACDKDDSSCSHCGYQL